MTWTLGLDRQEEVALSICFFPHRSRRARRDREWDECMENGEKSPGTTGQKQGENCDSLILITGMFLKSYKADSILAKTKWETVGTPICANAAGCVYSRVIYSGVGPPWVGVYICVHLKADLLLMAVVCSHPPYPILAPCSIPGELKAPDTAAWGWQPSLKASPVWCSLVTCLPGPG